MDEDIARTKMRRKAGSREGRSQKSSEQQERRIRIAADARWEGVKVAEPRCASREDVRV
jgi:hypothetical protein